MGTTNAENAVHWIKNTENYNAIVIDSTTDPEWSKLVYQYAAEWSKASGISIVVESEPLGLVSLAKNYLGFEDCPQEEGKIRVCNGEYSDEWTGHAYIAADGTSNHITSGFILFNDDKFSRAPTHTKPGETLNFKEAYMRMVVCQEFGHIFGLDHDDEDLATTKGTCMDYSDDPYPNMHPNAHDYEEIAAIYDHVHKSEGAGFMCTHKEEQKVVYAGAVPASEYFALPSASEDLVGSSWVVLAKTTWWQETRAFRMEPDEERFRVVESQTANSTPDSYHAASASSAEDGYGEMQNAAIQPEFKEIYQPYTSVDQANATVWHMRNGPGSSEFDDYDCSEWEPDIAKLQWDTNITYHEAGSSELEDAEEATKDRFRSERE